MEYKIQPWAHQLEAIKKAQALNSYALFFEMGTGKTGTAINILRHKFNEKRAVLRTLIFCPPIVCSNWEEEWRRFSKIDPARVVVLKGPQRKRVKDFLSKGYAQAEISGEKFIASQGTVFVTNYESLLMDDLYFEFRRWAPEAIIFDESHKIKNPKASRTKLAVTLANPWDQKLKRALPRPYVYILSGSPVLNSPLDLFSQFHALDGGATFGTNFFAFRARYFRDANAGMPKDRYFPNWQIIPGALEDINKRIFAIGMRVEKKDCLDLPPLVRMTHKVSMTPEQVRLYKEMKQHLITYLNDKACVATLAITKALRLMQIASGFVSVKGTGEESDVAEVELERTPKLEALRDLLEQLTPNHKVLVWGVWKSNYRQIAKLCQELAVGYVEVHGGISATGKEENVKRFRDDPCCRVFIGHPGSGGIGINLTCASYSIFYSRTFSLEHSLQAEARNHRGGSKEAGHEKITRIDLVCENTIEETIVEKLANKLQVSDKLLRDII